MKASSPGDSLLVPPVESVSLILASGTISQVIFCVPVCYWADANLRFDCDSSCHIQMNAAASSHKAQTNTQTGGLILLRICIRGNQGAIKWSSDDRSLPQSARFLTLWGVAVLCKTRQNSREHICLSYLVWWWRYCSCINSFCFSKLNSEQQNQFCWF